MTAHATTSKDDAKPSLVFDWVPAGRNRFGMLMAILLVGIGFVFLLLAVRVRLSPPVAWQAPQASVFHVAPDTDVGRILASRAQAEGPFPSRFDLASSAALTGMETLVAQATRLKPAPYQPSLRPFPRPEAGQSSLALRGEPVLPVRPLGPLTVPDAGRLARVPTLSAVSGLAAGDWQEPLPAFDAEIDVALAARSWRFMMRLDAAGRVHDCIPLSGGTEPGAAGIQRWLAKVRFRELPDAGDRWVAVSVEFRNRTVDDGTDFE